MKDPDDKGVIPAPVIRTRNVFRIVNGSPFFGLLTLIEEVGGTLPLFKLTRYRALAVDARLPSGR